MASVLLLFVAAGLLMLAGVGLGRWRGRGRPPSHAETALMAAMTGVAVTFLFVVMPVIPLVIFPFVVAGTLVATWAKDRHWRPLGAFLVGGGTLLVVMQAMQRANDIADPAVTIPGWTPAPMVIGAALAIIGAVLVAKPPRRDARGN
jgi:Na+/phosphate symporter